MICPHCLKKIEDTSTVCPHCGGYVDAEPARHADFVYCEGCGARLSSHDRTCPKCGRPAPGILSVDAAASDLAAGKTASFPKLQDGAVDAPVPPRTSAAKVLTESLDADHTTELRIDPGAFGDARAKSASPKAAPRAERDAAADPYHANGSGKGKLVLRCLAAAFIGIGIYFLAADPAGVMPGVYQSIDDAASDMFPSRQGAAATSPAEEDADDVGQGSADDAAEDEGPTQVADDSVLTDDRAQETLAALWEQIGAFQDPLGDVVTVYNGSYLLKDRSAREEASKSAYDLRDQVQATIDELDAIELAHDSVYAEDLDHLKTLAGWMYNRVDVLCRSWDISLAVPEGESMSAHESEILQPLRDELDATGQNENLVLFEQNYSSWYPAAK